MAVVGSAHVRIVADVSGLAKSIEDQLGGLDALGKKMGKSFGQKMREGIKEGIGDPADLIGEADGKKAGAAFGKGFGEGAKPHFDKLADGLGDGLGSKVAKDFNKTFKSNLDVKGPLKEQLVEGGKEGGDAAGDAAGKGVVDGTGKGGDKAARDLEKSGRRGGSNFGKGFSIGFGRAGKGFKPAPFEKAIESMIKGFVQLQTMGAMITGLIGAVSALASSVVGLASAFIYAAPAALKFANVLLAVGQAAVVAKTLFGGVGNAISAYSDSLKKSTKSSKNSSKSSKNLQKDLMSEEERLLRIREARDALNDAIIEGARANVDAIESVSDAQEALSDAIEDTDDAERDLLDAMVDEKKALDDLNDARAEAQERLEDLALELERASLNEERAALNLRKAEEQLANARAGGNANAIYEADLAYREQLQSVKELQESNGDLREEANKANEEGIEGNEDVIDAQRNYRDAIEETSDAQEALTDAIEATSDAQLELARAIEDVPRIAEDASIRIARAQLELKKALEGTKPAMADFGNEADGAADSIDKVAEAFEKLSPAAQDFVRFWVNRVIPTFEAIKQLGQEEFFPKFQQALESILDNIRLMDMLEQAYVDTASALGDISIQMADAFQTPESLDALQVILESNVEIIRDLGEAASNVVQPLLQIFEVTAPYAEAWTESVKDATQAFEDFIAGQASADIGGGKSPLEKFFQDAAYYAGLFWEVLKNVGEGLWTIIQAALPAGETLLIRLIDMSEQWALNLEANANSISSTFSFATDNAVALLDVMGDIGGVLFDLGANPAIGALARAVETIIPLMGELAEDGFNQVAGALERMILALPPILEFFKNTQVIEGFFETLAWVVEVISKAAAAMNWFLDIIERGVEWIGRITGLFDGFNTNLIQMITYAYGAFKAFTLLFNLIRTFTGGRISIPAISFGGFGGGKKNKAARTAQKSLDDVKAVMRREQKIIQAIAVEIGRDISQGIERGIISAKPSLLLEAQRLGAQVLEAVNLSIGRHSLPAKFIAVGMDIVRGIMRGITGTTPELLVATDQAMDLVHAEVKEGSALAGDQSANLLSEGYQRRLMAEGLETRRAGSELENQAALGMTKDAAADGSRSAGLMAEAQQSRLRLEIPETKRAAESVQTAAGVALQTDAIAKGRVGGSLIVEGYQRGAQSEIPETKLVMESVQIAAANSLTSGAVAKGIPGGQGLGEGIQLGLKMESPELIAAGALAAQQVQVGVNSNPVRVPVSAGPAVGGKGGAGKAAGAAAKGKGKRRALTAGLAALPIPGARIVAGGVTALSVFSMVRNSAQDTGEDIDQSFSEAGASSSEAMQGLGIVANDVMTQVSADTLNAMSDVELQTIQKMYDAGYLTQDAMAIVDEAVRQTTANSKESFESISNDVLASTDASQQELIRILYDAGALTAEAMAMVDEAVVQMEGDANAATVTIAGVGVVANEVMTETQAEIINTMDTVEKETIKSLYEAGYLTEDAMAIVDDAIRQTATTAELSFGEVSNEILAATDESQRALIKMLYDSGALTAEAMALVDTALIEMQTGVSANAEAMATDMTNAANTTGAEWTYATGQVTTDANAMQSSYSATAGQMTADSQAFADDTADATEAMTEDMIDDMENLEEESTSIWDRMGASLSGIWKGVVSGFWDAMEAISRGWNKYVIAPLNSLPFIDGLDEWHVTRPSGYAEGGLVSGPAGPVDNVLAALTPGEFVLTKDMVRQVGVGSLESWRRGGRPAASGGIGDNLKAAGEWVWETGKSAVEWTKDLAKEGALAIVSGILNKFGDLLPNRKYLNKFIDWITNGAAMKKWTDDITAEAKEAEEERIAKETSGGGNVPPYDGPPGGWTYPMAKRYSGKDWSGHNPPGSFDIGVPVGVLVRAASVGKVVASRDLGGSSYGQYIKISHAGGQNTLYAHLSKRMASGNVTTGQTIGKTGNTGGSSGPHLHFELTPLGFFDATRKNMAKKGVKLAAGGIVPATPGGMLALMGEAGRSERVTPLDNQGRSATEVEMLEVLRGIASRQAGGGDTFNVFPAPGMSERELAMKVSREVAFTHRRRS